MSQYKLSPQFVKQINSKDQIKILKKKLEMLKDSVKSYKQGKTQLQAKLSKQQQRCKDYQSDLKKKDQKNQHLLAQIRQLKDSILIQRNQKIKYADQLEQIKKKINANPQPTTGASKIGGYLGSLWK